MHKYTNAVFITPFDALLQISAIPSPSLSILTSNLAAPSIVRDFGLQSPCVCGEINLHNHICTVSMMSSINSSRCVTTRSAAARERKSDRHKSTKEDTNVVSGRP